MDTQKLLNVPLYTAVDIYAFGMCLIEIVSRAFPFAECTTTVQVYNKVMRGDRPRVLKRIKDRA